jgi:hypothetical protein
MHKGEEKCMQDFGWKTHRKRLLGSLRHSWEDNVITGLRERECMDWIVWLRIRTSVALL